MIDMLFLWIMLAVGVLWGMDLLIIQEAQHPVEAFVAGAMIGFALTNLLYLFTGI